MVELKTNVTLHVRLYPSRTTASTEMFLRELKQKHGIDDAEFIIDGAPWLDAGLFELGMHFRHETFGERNPVECVIHKIKRLTNQFYNTISRASPESAKEWVKTMSWAWNQPF